MIPYGKHYIDEDDINAVVDVMRSGFLTQGPSVIDFEHAFSKYVGANYAVAVSSGTAGLHLAAIVAGVGPGNNLVTSPVTFVASANAALYAGAKPIFADISPDTINLSPESLESVLGVTSDVRAVMPVHFSGLPCNMKAIKSAADKVGAVVIEDAAHALGASYENGKKVGCCDQSLMTVFSTHPVKAISTGEGGVITTNSEAIYSKLLSLRSHGISRNPQSFQVKEQISTANQPNPWYYEMQELGFNYRITDMQCGLGSSQLKKLDSFIARRAILAKKYDEAFFGMRHCRPAQPSGREISGHHLYVLRINFEEIGLSRAELMNLLRNRGVGSQVHYIPVPAHPYYRQLGYSPQKYPNAEQYYREALSIPMFYGLSDEQQDVVIDSIKAFLF